MSLFLSTLGLVLPAVAAPDVLTVNVGGTADFVDVQEAVDHAQSGDTILVRGPANSHYVFPAVTITKGLSLIGLADDRIRVHDLTIRDVPAGEAVTVVWISAGEDVAFPWTPTYEGLPRAGAARVKDCVGPVLLQGCRFHGGFGPGLRAVRSEILLVDCELEGGRGGDVGTSRTGVPNMQHALVLEDARASVSGSILKGASGGLWETFFPEIGGSGGDGVHASGASTLWLLDSNVDGGDGYEVEGLDPYRTFGGDGGAGVRLSPESRAYARASAIQGGLGGEGTTAPGQDGADVVGRLATLPGVSLDLDASLWTRDADLVTATIHGAPGAEAFLLIGDEIAFRSKGGTGVLVPDGRTRIALGPIPAGGTVTVPVPLPALTAGSVHRLVLQSALQESTGLALGEARILVVLDESWLPDRPLRVYVDPNAPPGGDGRSWSSAFRDLRRALEVAPGLAPTTTDVWLREGTYRPLTRAAAPIDPFFVKSHTRVFGGFAGTETDLSQRDVLSHPTILSGDLLGDDTATDWHRFDNSRLVVAIGPWERRERVRLDGLVIRAGYAQGFSWLMGTPFKGSGVELCGSVDIVGCTFVDNRFAPALHTSDGSEVRVIGCRFLGNGGDELMADGLGTVRAGWWDGTGSALFANCEFAGNLCSSGGGLYLNCATRIVNCSFYGNYADYQGGAVYANNCPSLVMENTLLWQNTSPRDPDFYVDVTRTATSVHFCLFQGGSSSPLGRGNIDGPPRLADPAGSDGILGTLDDDLTPLLRSPAVDAGSNVFLPTDDLDLDLDGDPREPLPIDCVGRPRRVDDPNVPDTGSGTPPIVDIGSREKP